MSSSNPFAEGEEDTTTRHFNRPGLSQLQYRPGTQPEILERMLKGIASFSIPGESPDEKPLSRLSARSGEDASVALLDAWASTLDVLGFYQERIANEGYIRTAIERRSVLEQARGLGYELKPGVAASAALAFTVEDIPDSPAEVTVARGTGVLSIPEGDELPRTFETLEDFQARLDWNELRPRLKSAQTIETGSTGIYLTGTSTGLQKGDKIVIADSSSPVNWNARTVAEVQTDDTDDTTLITWTEPLSFTAFVEPAKTYAFRASTSLFGESAVQWDSLTLEQQAELAFLNITTYGVALFNSSDYFVSAGGDGRIGIWDLSNGEHIRALQGHTGPVRDVALSPDDTKIVSAGEDGTVRVWDIAAGTELLNIAAHTGVVRAVSFAPDGLSIISAGEDGELIAWDAAAGTENGRFTGHSAAVQSILFKSDGTRVYSASADQTVRIWDAATRAELTQLTGHNAQVTDIALSANETHLLSAGGDSKLRMWELTGNTQVDEFEVFNTLPLKVAFFPTQTDVDGKPERFLAANDDGSVREFTLQSGGAQTFATLQTVALHTSPVQDAIYTLDGLRVLSAGTDAIRLHDSATGDPAAQLLPPTPSWFPTEWPGFENAASQIDLDGVFPRVVNPGFVLLEDENVPGFYEISAATDVVREDFQINAKISRLDLTDNTNLQNFGLRETTVYMESEELPVVEQPITRTSPIEGDRIELDGLAVDLNSGKQIIVRGKRSRVQVREGVSVNMLSTDGSQRITLGEGDILVVLETPSLNVDGDQEWKLISLTGFSGTVVQPDGIDIFDIIPAAEDDEEFSEIAVMRTLLQSQKYSTLVFNAPLQFSFDPATVIINANIVTASDGETVEEILGSGDNSIANQVFALREPPLTYVSAATASGTRGTLEIRVNDVLWTEADSLHSLGPRDQKYSVRIDDDGTTRVLFGDGINGERLPTGEENVIAVYRKGIGLGGVVAANALQILQTRPPGISAVTNPLSSSGGADSETLDTARDRTPLSVQTLDRIVSLTDFADFARSFAGIGKAASTDFQIDDVHLVHLTVAGENGEAVITDSALHVNLNAAVNAAQSPFQQVQIDSYQPLFFNVAARLFIDARFEENSVLNAAEAVLRNRFNFALRSFAQPITASEIVAALQEVDGVVAVDLDQLYRDDLLLFNMELDLQEELENTSVIRESFRLLFNAELAALSLTELTAEALVFTEKEGERWLLTEPEAETGYSIIKEKGKLNVYDYSTQVTPILEALEARLVNDVIEPAQLLLLNPDPAGVILSRGLQIGNDE